MFAKKRDETIKHQRCYFSTNFASTFSNSKKNRMAKNFQNINLEPIGRHFLVSIFLNCSKIHISSNCSKIHISPDYFYRFRFLSHSQHLIHFTYFDSVLLLDQSVAYIDARTQSDIHFQIWVLLIRRNVHKIHDFQP